MTNWSQFTAASPDLASFGKLRLKGRVAYLATIRPDGTPRLHPVSPLIAKNCLFVYMEPSSRKGYDLRRDASYAMHCGVEDNTGGQGEFLIRGHAIEVNDAEAKEDAFRQARMMGYNPQERYVLFELRIQEAMATLYEQGEPKRTRWKAVEVIDGPTQRDQDSNDSR
jgi:hypothetical protein